MDFKCKKPGGIYVHIPFCQKKCPYCDFYSITDLSLKHRFLRALLGELERSRPEFLYFDTLYIGGGTPSVFDADQIRQVIETVWRHFDVLPGAELTMEVNPGATTLEQLTGYIDAGINRLNIGVQSFQDPNLNFLGRIHSANDAILAYEGARRAGFDNVGIDLIYGLAKQTQDNWLIDLKSAVTLEPDHLSCYMLTYEPGTIFHQNWQSGTLQPLDDRRLKELFDLTIAYLETQGYVQYEISNFARELGGNGPPKRSRHNLKYWSLTPYLGFGPSAHSFVEPKRYWNYSDVRRYISEIEAARLPVADEEVLSTEQLMMEVIFLSLRTIAGIDLDGFNHRFGMDFLDTFEETINDLEKRDLLRMVRNRCALTRKGLAFCDRITSIFTSQEIETELHTLY